MTSVQSVPDSVTLASSPWATSPLENMTVSSWARISSGTPSVSIADYPVGPTISWTPPGTNSSTALTAERTGNAPITQHSNMPVLIPLFSVVGAALLFAVFISVIRIRRRKRALAAHRRRHSWAAAHKYRWDTHPTYRDIEASEGTEAPPAYTFTPTTLAPPTPVPRVMTHDRHSSVF